MPGVLPEYLKLLLVLVLLRMNQRGTSKGSMASLRHDQ